MLKVYISHSIRGKHGNDATHAQMKANNIRAKTFGTWLRTNFPDVSWYIPGELDGFLLERGVEPIKVIEGLIALDFAIIDVSDGMLIYAPDECLSSGMLREKDHAETTDKPIDQPRMLEYAHGDTLRLNIQKFIERISNE